MRRLSIHETSNQILEANGLVQMRRRLTVEVEGPTAVGAAVAGASEPSAKAKLYSSVSKKYLRLLVLIQRLNVEKMATSKGWSEEQNFLNKEHMVLRVQMTLRS
jgi:hypothetical protein